VIVVQALCIVALVIVGLARYPSQARAQAMVEFTQITPVPGEAQGQVVTLLFELRNNMAMDGYNVTVTSANQPPNVLISNPGTMFIAPNSTQLFSLTVFIPAGLEPGTHVFTVTAQGARATASTGPTAITVTTFGRFVVIGPAVTPTATPQPDSTYCSFLPAVGSAHAEIAGAHLTPTPLVTSEGVPAGVRRVPDRHPAPRAPLPSR
jgi:hypothetical protein